MKLCIQCIENALMIAKQVTPKSAYNDHELIGQVIEIIKHSDCNHDIQLDQ